MTIDILPPVPAGPMRAPSSSYIHPRKLGKMLLKMAKAHGFKLSGKSKKPHGKSRAKAGKK